MCSQQAAVYRIGGGSDGRSVQSVTRQATLPRIQQNAVTSVLRGK